MKPGAPHPIGVGNTPAARKAIAVNDAIGAASSLPNLILRIEALDPRLAAALKGKALISSKTPWVTLAAAAVAYLGAKYALGYDEGLCALAAALGLLVASYAMRAVSAGRITGLVSRPPIGGARSARL